MNKLCAIAVASTAFCTSGCASLESLSTETKVEELAYQALNVADGVQTKRWGDYPDCYQETGNWRAVTGRNPSASGAATAAVITGLLHLGGTLILDRIGNQTMLRVWEGVTVTTKGFTVGSNAKLIRDNKECERHE